MKTIILFILAIAIVGCGEKSVKSGDYNKTSIKEIDAMIIAINKEREKGGVCGDTYYAPSRPLIRNELLEMTASYKNYDMITYNYFGHQNYNGDVWYKRIRDVISVELVGENLAAGQTSISDVVNAWMNSELHCKNLLEPRYRYIGYSHLYSEDSTYLNYYTIHLSSEK